MKFCVFTDLHYDVIPDGNRRIHDLLADCKRQQVDFILELGDLCHPTEENHAVLTAFQNARFPCYFSLGNHNIDFCSLETALEFLGLNCGHYTVIKDHVKFVFLNAAYTDAPSPAPYIPPEQLRWLKQEISDDRYFYVICTHQSLHNNFVTAKGKPRGIANRAEVRAILEQRNQEKKRVLLCMNGHDHGNALKIIGGIPYYTLNSASYFWQDVRPMYPYSPEVHRQYPYLKNMVLYQEPLHSIVTIDTAGTVAITGMHGHYLTVTPNDIGMEPIWDGVSVLPQTLSLTISNA